MKTSRTNQATGGKGGSGLKHSVIKLRVNYQDHAQSFRPSKHAKQKGKPN
jgi:hypothetical protein